MRLSGNGTQAAVVLLLLTGCSDATAPAPDTSPVAGRYAFALQDEREIAGTVAISEPFAVLLDVPPSATGPGLEGTPAEEPTLLSDGSYSFTVRLQGSTVRVLFRLGWSDGVPSCRAEQFPVSDPPRTCARWEYLGP